MTAGAIRRTAVALAAGTALLVAASVSTAATGSTAGHSASALCGQGRITVGASMQQVQSVAAVPTTSNVQYVAHRALLFRWTGQAWQHAATGAWLWGRASTASPAETWQTFDTGQPGSTTFTASAGTYYAVAVQYYWYGNGDVGSGSDYQWAQHQDMAGPSNGYCKA